MIIITNINVITVMILNSNNDNFSSLNLGDAVESKVARVPVFRSQRGHQLNALVN